MIVVVIAFTWESNYIVSCIDGWCVAVSSQHNNIKYWLSMKETVKVVVYK